VRACVRMETAVAETEVRQVVTAAGVRQLVIYSAWRGKPAGDAGGGGEDTGDGGGGAADGGVAAGEDGEGDDGDGSDGGEGGDGGDSQAMEAVVDRST